MIYRWFQIFFSLLIGRINDIWKPKFKGVYSFCVFVQLHCWIIVVKYCLVFKLNSDWLGRIRFGYFLFANLQIQSSGIKIADYTHGGNWGLTYHPPLRICNLLDSFNTFNILWIRWIFYLFNLIPFSISQSQRDKFQWIWFMGDAFVILMFVAVFYIKEWRIKHLTAKRKDKTGFNKGKFEDGQLPQYSSIKHYSLSLCSQPDSCPVCLLRGSTTFGLTPLHLLS